MATYDGADSEQPTRTQDKENKPDADSWQFMDEELWEMANKIGNDWYNIGITLGFNYSQLELVECLYKHSPVQRNFKMLYEWCRCVHHHQLNPKLQLAAHLSKAGRKDLADSLGEYYNYDVKTSERVHCQTKTIVFEIKPRNEKPTVVFEGPVSVDHLVLNVDLKDVEPSQMKITEQESSGSTWITKLNNRVGEQEMRKSTWNTQLNNLVEDLSLEKYIPGKISLQDVRHVKNPDILFSLKLVPWLLLEKIMILNYKAREEDLCFFYDKMAENVVSKPDDSDDDIFEDPGLSKQINPMDLFLVTFLACDLPLQQEILSKLFTCRLAIPLIYRNQMDKIVLTKWAMKQIVISNHTGDKSCYVNALNCDAKRVSFIRLGQPSLSKSKLINEILSDQNHPTFYNRDCPLGASRRVVADGTVEGAWFMTSGRPNDVFNENVMFLNLRGDAMYHTEELVLLSQLSDVIVVNTHIKQLQNDTARTLLFKIHEKSIFVIYALEWDSSDGPNSQPKVIWKDFKIHMPQCHNHMKCLNLQSMRSASDKTKELRKNISDVLASCKSSSYLRHINQSSCFTDDITLVKESEKLSIDLMDRMNETLAVQNKASSLPLQGKLWKEYSQVKKTWDRSKSVDERQQLEQKMHDIRNSQRKLYQTGNHMFINQFDQHIRVFIYNPVPGAMNAYISLITSDLNEKSRKTLPRIRNEYKENWHKMKLAKGKDYICLKQKVDESEKELVDASFGIEHMIRELGQIYEALASVTNIQLEYKTTMVEYTKFASQLLILGYPFEIMDGDTAMVPLTWVKAVFQQLEKDLDDEKLLAISVLGIQSSGKSTLLNTMFGLKFPVSAGRCTRGVYVQLIPVAKKILPFSYIMVIDTEGLRAPELADEKYSHDNELATFVLGLGNITIINIKGENTSEIENVLQIAVHAFLRLMLANKNLKLQQTCIFAHQNVPAEDAHSAMIHARQKMLDKLDKMICEAANQEGLADITSFNQVIEIDPQSHMWYFSDLFYGDPPMSPINLGYSEKVAELKRHIMFDIASTKEIFLTISETFLRIEDLWNGILSDDFVFNFRNSLEMKAYNAMESKYNKVTWEIESKTFDFVRETAPIKLASCATIDELQNEVVTLRNRLKREINKSHFLSIGQWKTFFDTYYLRDIMEQWRESRLVRLNEFVIGLEHKAIRNIEKTKMQAKADLVRTTKRKTHELELKKRANDLVSSTVQSIPPKDLLEKTFLDMWKEFVGGIEHEVEIEDKPISDQIEDILFNTFLSERPYISKELKAFRSRQTNLVSLFSFTSEQIVDGDISFYQHITVLEIHKLAMNVIHVTLKKIETYISSIERQDVPFEQTFVTTVFGILADSIDEHNSGFGDRTHFKLTAALKVKLAVHISQYITHVFTKLDQRYQERHNTVAQLEDYKTLIWQRFNDSVANETDSVKMSNALLTNVEKSVEYALDTWLPNEVLKMVVSDYFSTKYHFMLALMRDLAEKEDFDNFNWYITDAESYAKKWITEFSENLLFASPQKLKSIAADLIKKCINIIHRSSDGASLLVNKKPENERNIIVWNKEFENILGNHLPIKHGGFEMLDILESADFRIVHSHFKEQLGKLEKRLQNKFEGINAENVVWKGDNPCNLIFDHLWGCNHTCPFCNEPCHRSTQHLKEPHTCIQHRPIGLKGVREKGENILLLDTCNYCINSSNHFSCGVSDSKCQQYGNCKAEGPLGNKHAFKDYSKLFPDWEIEPSACMESSQYWMWFTYRFREQLASNYDVTLPNVVESWKKINKTEAMDSLKG